MTSAAPPEAGHARLGVILVALGAIGFGLLPIFLEILRDEQVNSGSSLIARYAGSAIPLGLWVLWKRPQWRGVMLALVAGLGIGGGTIFLFEGYARLPASMAILGFYTYPAFTLGFARLLFGTPMERRMIAAIVMVVCAAGLILSPEGLDEGLYGFILMTFGAPIGYALYLSCLGRIPHTVDPGLRTLLLSISACVVAVIYTYVAEGGMTWPVSPIGWVSLFYLALVTGIGATMLVVVGTAMAGSSRAAVAGSSELITVLMVGWWIFGEEVRIVAVIGAALILAAIIVSLPRRRSGKKTGAG
ncbi:MAG: DMT family transporter [Rhodospirillaceae bacterium]|nr:DMT family transporter [Rhodospirillaceae bacterium]